ncbi:MULTISPECIES: endonuclease domain-containing protein [unclassified Geodermatophilus]
MTRHLLPPIYTRAAADVAELTRAQLAGDGVRVTRGAFVSRSVPLTTANAARAALAVLPEGAVASHRTAAVLLGAPLRASWPLEFAVRPGVYRARRQRVRVHVRDLTAQDEVRCTGIPVTSGPQTWLDLAARMSGQELVAVGDALYRAGHLDAAALAERLERADGVRGVVRARECAPLLTPLAASRPESLIRYWLVSSELPDPVPQLPVVDRGGRTVAHADLGYEQWQVALEYEGRHHAGRRQFRRDLDRYTLMAAHGWLVLRFGEDDLGRRDQVLSRVAGALRSRGARW